jgi:hypothetical protein
MNAKATTATDTETPKVDTRKLTTKGCKEFKSRVDHTQKQWDQMVAAINKGMTYAEINRKDGPITAGDGHKFVGYALNRKWVKFA